MLNITLIVVGRIKEKYFASAIDEYTKRLSRYCKINIIELKDESASSNPSDGEIENILKKEGDRILEKINLSSHVIPLCIEGIHKSSEQLADIIADAGVRGFSEITFIIGGSYGLSDKVKNRADLKLSFSKMTFPHQLMRVILLEQIYRAFGIKANSPYHK